MGDWLSYVNQEYDCRLCCEMQDFAASLFAQAYPGLLSHNLFMESAQLATMLPIGPLMPGHLLLVAKYHAWSFGHIIDAVSADLLPLMNRIALLLARLSSNVLFFEHGPVSEQARGGCCLDHAHLNAVPLPEDLNLRDCADRFVKFAPCTLHDTAAFVRKQTPYLFLYSQKEGGFLAEAPNGSHQFFRKLIASHLGLPSWDWRDALQPESVRSTLSLLEESPSE